MILLFPSLKIFFSYSCFSRGFVNRRTTLKVISRKSLIKCEKLKLCSDPIKKRNCLEASTKYVKSISAEGLQSLFLSYKCNFTAQVERLNKAKQDLLLVNTSFSWLLPGHQVQIYVRIWDYINLNQEALRAILLGKTVNWEMLPVWRVYCYY